jgi:aspartate/methionine/tyrosine aminotransferase
MSIPKVIGDPRYPEHLKNRAKVFEMRANEAYDAFKDIDGVIVNRPRGAFYFSVIFEDGVLNAHQTLPIEKSGIRDKVQHLVEGVPADKRFVYYLMASAGICVTPFSGFHSDLNGFRMTLLRQDDKERRDTLKRLTTAIAEYVASALI